jgi:hypothetical protein
MPLLRKAGIPVAAATLILTAVVSAGHRGTPVGSAPGSPSNRAAATTPARAAHPRLVVPGQADPGERVTVLAHRNRRLCGRGPVCTDAPEHQGEIAEAALLVR